MGICVCISLVDIASLLPLQRVVPGRASTVQALHSHHVSVAWPGGRVSAVPASVLPQALTLAVLPAHRSFAP